MFRGTFRNQVTTGEGHDQQTHDSWNRQKTDMPHSHLNTTETSGCAGALDPSSIVPISQLFYGVWVSQSVWARFEWKVGTGSWSRVVPMSTAKARGMHCRFPINPPLRVSLWECSSMVDVIEEGRGVGSAPKVWHSFLPQLFRPAGRHSPA